MISANPFSEGGTVRQLEQAFNLFGYLVVV